MFVFIYVFARFMTASTCSNLLGGEINGMCFLKGNHWIRGFLSIISQYTEPENDSVIGL